MEENTSTIEMPAGSYWLGDPCWSIDDRIWVDWLRTAKADPDNQGMNILVAKVNTTEAIGLVTARGAGYFPTSIGIDLPTNTSLIGLVPVAESTSHDVTSLRNDAVLFERDKAFYCHRHSDGRLVFDDVIVFTG